MNGPASTPTPTDLWEVFYVIAERTPPNQLIWLALILCLSVLVFKYLVYLTCASFRQAAKSKPADAPINHTTNHMPTEESVH